MKTGVVQRPATLAALEHRRQKRERHVARHSGDECVELLVGRARFGEKRAELHLTDVDLDAARREVRLDELLERVISATDGQKVELEWASSARAPTVGLTSPARGVEKLVGGGAV